MRLILRALPLALIYAVLTGPATPANWVVGAVLGLPLTAAIGGARAPTGLAEPARLVLLPWFVLGVLWRMATGSWRTLRLIARRRAWSAPGFVTCRTGAETEDGVTLLALVESISPGSATASIETGRLRTNVVDARDPEGQCDELRRWYRRFQKPMLP